MCAIRATSFAAVALPMAATLPANAQTCATYQTDMAAAYAAKDCARAAEIATVATQVCRGTAMDAIGRNAALVHVRCASDATNSSAKRSEFVAIALRFGRPWQASATAGDIAMAEKRHTQAAQFFQDALDDIRNERLNPTPPESAVIATLVRKAEAASLLSKTHVARVDRSGAVGGLACPTFRGFTVKRTAVPIEFEYKEPGFQKFGADAFTGKGQQAAEDLVSYLIKQGVTSVHLIGHTDQVGSDAYNLALSARRADAVAAFLKTKGYSGIVRTSGHGRQQPFEADDPGSYTEAERHQMDRRVELEREGGEPCATPSN